MKTLSTCIGFALFCCILLTASQGAQADLIRNVSDIKNLGSGQLRGGESRDVTESSPEASNVGLFTVPANKNFVITTVTFIPDVPSSNVIGVVLSLADDGIATARIFDTWTVPMDHQTQLQFPTGLRVAPGFHFIIGNTGPAGENPIRVRINGYLVQSAGSKRR